MNRIRGWWDHHPTAHTTLALAALGACLLLTALLETPPT